MTAESAAASVLQSRVKVSRLENGHMRPDLAEVMKLFDVYGATGDEWLRLVQLARGAAERGWWDSYGDSMAPRQRVYADIESGAVTIREYQLGVMTGLLQLPEYTWELIELAQLEGPLRYDAARSVAARAERQKILTKAEPPKYEVILDEVGLRRFTVSEGTMAAQLRHAVRTAERLPHVTLRVLPLVTGRVAVRLPRSDLALYTFEDPEDLPLAASATDADVHTTDPAQFARLEQRYNYVRDAALAPLSSLSLLSDLANEIGAEAGSRA